MRHPQTFVQLCLVIALALGLAGCSGADAPAGPGLPATPTTPALQVALLSPASGELATFGRMMRDGSIMALETQNAGGGLLGHHLEWVTYDSGCDFEMGQQAARQALADGLEFIIGPLCSAGAIAAAEVAEAGGALLIAPAATHPLVTLNSRDRTRPAVFRAAAAYSLQGQAAARFGREELGAGRAAILFDPHNDYSAGLAEAFAGQFVAGGGQIVYRGATTPGQADFGELAAAVRSSGSQVAYLPATPAVVNDLARRLKEPGAGVTLLGSDSWQNGELDLAAAAGSYYTVHFSSDDPRPELQAWREAYKAIYAVEPTTLAALGYDAARMLIAAIQEAGVPEAGPAAAALEQAAIDGAAGRFWLDSRHNPVKAMPVLAIRAGQASFAASVTPDEAP